MADRRLNGFNPLSYLGTNPYTPPDTVLHPRDPVSTDSQNFELGTFWLNTVNESLWVLVNLNQGVATWVELSIGSGGTVDKLHTSDGHDVTPTAGRINLANGDNITTTGTVGPNTVTISLSGTTNHSLQLGNTAGSLTSLGVATNGQLPIGSTGTDPVLATLTAGSGITISNGAGSIEIATSGTMATTYHTDSGDAAPAANILNVFGGTSGRDVDTSGSGNTIHIDLKNAITLGDLSSIIGSPAITCTTGDITLSAGNINLPLTNTAATEGVIYMFNGATNVPFIHQYSGTLTIGSAGGAAGNFTGTAPFNIAIGGGALAAYTTGNGCNTSIGVNSMNVATTAFDNVALGVNGLATLTTGSNNVAIGTSDNNGSFGGGALDQLKTGSFNVAIGNVGLDAAGRGYTGAESSNIVINNFGVNGESNVIRIGTTGTGNGQQSTCYIAGITGVTVSNQQFVTINSSTGQLGVTASGITNLSYTPVSTSPYVVLTTDEYISVDTSSIAITIQLPNAATSGRVFVIKDRTGNAATHNITVTTVGGAVNIDGATTFVMNTAFQSINVIGNGTSYEIF